MARPHKETVDYFPHDADASESRTLSILYNNFGHDGISCWWQLLERVSKTRNHVISLRNGEDLEFLAAKLRFSSERLQAILGKMAELDAIDKALFDTGLIWVTNFIDRVAPVYKTRQQRLPTKPSLNGEETKLSIPETELITPKVHILKDTKVKDTKVEKREFLEFVETKKTEFPNLDIEKELAKFNLYWSEGTRKLQRPKTAFQNWLEKATEFKQNGKGNTRGLSKQVSPDEYRARRQ